MSTEVAFDIGSNLWNAHVYKGFSLASELSAQLSQPRRLAFSFAYQWKMRGLLSRLNAELSKILAGVETDVRKSQDEHKSAYLSNDLFRWGRDHILRWHDLCTQALALETEWPRDLRTQVEHLRSNTERLLDIADWLDAMSTPEETASKFEAALAEWTQGDVIPWTAMQ